MKHVSARILETTYTILIPLCHLTDLPVTSDYCHFLCYLDDSNRF
jgi:hypothetical protein